ERGGRGVRVAVVGYLVAGGGDLFHALRMPLRDPTRDEERCGDRLSLQEREDQRNAHLRPIRPLGKDGGPRGVLGIFGDPHLLGVEIERERDGRKHPVRPHELLRSSVETASESISGSPTAESLL